MRGNMPVWLLVACLTVASSDAVSAEGSERIAQTNCSYVTVNLPYTCTRWVRRTCRRQCGYGDTWCRSRAYDCGFYDRYTCYQRVTRRYCAGRRYG